MHNKIDEIRKDKEKAMCFFSKLLAFSLGPVELKTFMDENKVKVVDVRRNEDFEISHIPGAVSIPEEELADSLNQLSKDEVTVVYSYNQQCHLGIRACLTLADYGYPVMHLDGGFKTWVEDFRFTTT